MGKLTEFLGIVDKVQSLSDKIDEHYQLLSEVYSGFSGLSKTVDHLTDSIVQLNKCLESFDENKRHLEAINKKVDEANSDYLGRLSLNVQLMDELHVLTGKVGYQLALATNLLRFAINEEHETKIREFENGLKGLSDEGKETKKSCKKMCDGGEASQRGHEDVPKRKAGRPRS